MLENNGYLRPRILLVSLLLLFSGSSAFSQTTTFTYQGRLQDGGSPANGSYDLQFTLWDTSSGGTQQPQPSPVTVTRTSVLVTGGIFTVQLDFGASAFPGTNRFLEIGVRPAGGGAFTILLPRQQITSTPYAIRSANAANADTATTATNATNATTATNAMQLGGVAANQYVLTGDLRMTDARAPTAGSANYIQNQTASTQSAGFNISGNGTIGGNLIANGNVGIGTSTPSEKLTVQTAPSNYGFIHTDGTVTVGSYVGGSTGGGWYGTKSNHPLSFFTNDSGSRLTIATNGNVGIGTTTPMALLHVSATGPFTTAIFGDSIGNAGVFGRSDITYGVLGRSGSGTGVRSVSVSGDLFSGADGGLALRFRVTNGGQVRSDVGFATPAADFAELIEVDESGSPETESSEPGDVLVISPETGKLRKSNQRYSTQVAGIYSTKPGFLGGQAIEDKNPAHTVPVAMVGIVPTKVSAENGAIRPGDLLTTSSTPGYAMKASPVTVEGVKVYPTGAILGKALEPLKRGKGVIKVLVMLR